MVDIFFPVNDDFQTKIDRIYIQTEMCVCMLKLLTLNCACSIRKSSIFHTFRTYFSIQIANHLEFSIHFITYFQWIREFSGIFPLTVLS